jgi:hypothetical protein
MAGGKKEARRAGIAKIEILLKKKNAPLSEADRRRHRLWVSSSHQFEH